MIAPPGFTWRPSGLPHLKRVMVLIRDSDQDHRGSIGPHKNGWVDRDTGEVFANKVDAQANVEKFK